MRTFIIYIQHPKSIAYAKECLLSFKRYTGWEPELFEGITPATLPQFENYYPLKIREKSRVSSFWKDDKTRYYTKKACSMNHYKLFKHCIKINEPIAVIEHDSHCIGNWECPFFDNVLVLNIKSAMARPVLEPIHKYK